MGDEGSSDKAKGPSVKGQGVAAGKGEGGRLAAAAAFLAGEDAALEGVPETPGLWSFVRANWGAKGAAKQESGWARFRRLSQEFTDAKERQAKYLHTYESIAGAAGLSKEFVALLVSSCLIATLGLVKGSTGVIIGAMLVAPLMMPILGFALATTWGDQRLLLRSMATLGIGVVVAVLSSFALASAIPLLEMNAEIAGRAHPDLYDILVALVSGMIGAYAFANPKISSSITGVAIAVALMPPLCTVGIGLAMGSSQVALGAMLLFLSNLFGIAVAAAFVFWRLRVHPVAEQSATVGARTGRNAAVAALLLVAVGVPLTYWTRTSYARKSREAAVRALIEESLPAAEILTLKSFQGEDGVHLRSVLVLPRGEKPDRKLEKKIAALLEDPAEVRVTVLRP